MLLLIYRLQGHPEGTALGVTGGLCPGKTASCSASFSVGQTWPANFTWQCLNSTHLSAGDVPLNFAVITAASLSFALITQLYTWPKVLPPLTSELSKKKWFCNTFKGPLSLTQRGSMHPLLTLIHFTRNKPSNKAVEARGPIYKGVIPRFTLFQEVLCIPGGGAVPLKH